jgi:hypothetical protein
MATIGLAHARRFALAIALAIAAAVVCAAGARAAPAAAPTPDPPVVRSLKAEYQGLVAAARALTARQKDLLARQNAQAREIEALQDSEPGLLGRLRLERLLAANLALSNQLSEIAADLAANDKARGGVREAVYRAYTNEMEEVVRNLRQATDRGAARRLAHRFYELLERRAPWQTVAVPEGDFSRTAVEVGDQDSAQDLSAKADLLADLAAKVRAAIADVDKEIQRLRRETKLATEMNAMVKEMNLFEEGARFTRRPEDAARVPETLPNPPTGADDRALLATPLLPEQQEALGAERAAKSWSNEVKRLEDERKALSQLLSELTARADALRKAAHERKSRDAAGG